MILAKLAIGAGAVMLVGTTYLVQDGFVHVGIDEFQPDGTHLHLIVPAVLAPIAAEVIPERHLHEVREQAAPYLPMVRAAIQELSKLPDSTLVEVKDAHDHVLITKAGGGLKIEVESPEEHVNVWVPLRAAYDAAGALQLRFGSNEDEKRIR